MSNEPLDPNEEELPVEPNEELDSEEGIVSDGHPIHPDPIKP